MKKLKKYLINRLKYLTEEMQRLATLGDEKMTRKQKFDSLILEIHLKARATELNELIIALKILKI